MGVNVYGLTRNLLPLMGHGAPGPIGVVVHGRAGWEFLVLPAIATNRRPDTGERIVWGSEEDTEPVTFG